MAKEAREGYIIVGKTEWKLSWFKSVTLEHAINVHPNFNVNSIKKVWKIANGLSIPNHLKEKLKAEEKADK